MYKDFSEKTAVKVIDSMLKEKEIGERYNLRFTWWDDCDRVCAVDGFRAFRVAANLKGLPVLADGVDHMDLDRLFPALDGLRELEKPELSELNALAAYDRRHDGKKRGKYMFGPGLPVVNLHYLRDALRVYPDLRLYYSDNVSPILIMSEHGDGVILPIRVPDDWRERRETIWNLPTFAARFTV